MLREKKSRENFSGYIRINMNLIIKEVSGDVADILKISNIELNKNFSDFVSLLEKNLRSFLLQEILPSIHKGHPGHFSFNTKKTKLKIAIILMNSDEILVSFEKKTKSKIGNENILEKLKEIYLRIDSDLIIQDISKNCAIVFGKKRSEIKGRSFEDIEFQGLHFQLIIEHINQAFLLGKKIVKDFRIENSLNQEWWRISISPELDSSNLKQTLILIFENISPLKDLGGRLHEAELRLQLISSSTNLGIWENNPPSKKVIYSNHWKTMLGYQPNEIKNNFDAWIDLLHPDDKDRIQEYIQLFLKSDSLIYEAEFRLKHKNGNYLWIKSRVAVIRNENGVVTKIIGTNNNISKGREIEEAFERYDQVILQSPIPILITDSEGNIEFFNPAFCKVSGWSEDDLVGKGINIPKSDLHAEGFFSEIWQSIKKGNTWRGEMINKRKNGELFFELVNISPIKNRLGSITHFVRIAEDINYLKEIEKALKEAKKDAELASRNKNHFLANMSHQIRTPLNSIVGFSELLKNPELGSDKQLNYSMIIKENTQAVLRLLDDIIDISKIEANEIVIKKEAVPLAELFSELNIVYHSYFKRRQKRNLKVIFTLPTEARNEIIFTDSYRLKQILNNLYLNALDRTEQGHIEVGYEILDGQIIRFFVSDNGYGIPPEEVKNLFNRHNIINESISSYDNSGLGLPICKNLAKALGGDILVKSDIDHGSTFYFTLPIEKLELPNVKQFEKIEKRNGFDFSHYHILVADDKPFNLSFFGNLIEKTGAKIFWAKDGIDILNIFKNYKIDLILMDIELAEINGFDVAAEIRRYNSEVPIIVQSTFLKVDDQQKCYDIGCNDILIQPINENDVLAVISKFLK